MVLAAGKIQNSSPGVHALTRSYRRYLSLPAPDGKSASHYMRTDSLSNTALQQGGTLLFLSLLTYKHASKHKNVYVFICHALLRHNISAVVQLFMFYCNICVWTFHVIKTKLLLVENLFKKNFQKKNTLHKSIKYSMNK